MQGLRGTIAGVCGLLLAVSAACVQPAEGQPVAPELEPNLGWLNTDRPLRLGEELKGHVVLLDFWTFCCINCMHVMPDLEYLEDKYADEPFVVVGVHSAKFANEAQRESIRNAIFRYGLRHPVVIDKEMGIWNRYGTRSWPTLVLIGSDGRVIGAAPGEGNRLLLDKAISQALADGRKAGTLADKKVSFRSDAQVPAATGLAFPGKVLAGTDRLFVADSSHDRVIVATMPDRLGRSKLIRIIGSGRRGLADGPPDVAKFNDPQGMALDAKANVLFVADTNNHALRRVDLETGRVETIVGDGTQHNDRTGGQAGLDQGLNSPWALALSPDRATLYLAMAGSHQLWKVDLATMVATAIAGGRGENILDGPGKTAMLAQPSGLALSGDGKRLYFADSEGSAVRVYEIDSGQVSTIIGRTATGPFDNALFDFGDVDGAFPDARLQHPLGVTVLPGPEGERLLVADTYNHKIKIVDPSARTSSAWAGAGRGIPASEGELRLDEPGGVAYSDSPEPRLFIADTNNNRIVMVDAGDGTWHEVELSGMVSGDAGAPTVPEGAIRATVLAVPDTALDLSIAGDVPAGFHPNPEAPTTVRVTRLGDDPGVVAQRTLRTDSFPVSIRVPAGAVADGSRLLVELSFAACGDDLAVCRPGGGAWVVSLRQGEATSAALGAN